LEDGTNSSKPTSRTSGHGRKGELNFIGMRRRKSSNLRKAAEAGCTCSLRIIV
jgi:hypothetical protein